MHDSERMLATSRLTLEPILPSHAPMLYDQLNDDRMWHFIMLKSRPRSVDHLEQRYQRYATRSSPDGKQTWLNYALRLADGSYVGTVQATVEGNRASIGYGTFADHWRQGYGTEACRELLRFLFDECAVVTVTATVDSENVASMRLLQALGFTRARTGPSQDMPGRTDHFYECQRAVPGAPSPL